MFSTIVAWIVFVFTSLIPVFLIIDAILNRDYNERMKMIAASQGLAYGISYPKMCVVFAVWFAAGYYLFG